MSGGHFDYIQFRIAEIVESIRGEIANNESTDKDEYGEERGRHYPPEVIERFEIAARTMDRAMRMATRVDWLLSADDGEDSFLRRWKEEGLDDRL